MFHREQLHIVQSEHFWTRDTFLIVSSCGNTNTSIHPLSKLFILLRLAGGWSLSQHTLGERQGAPLTGRPSVTGLTRVNR